METKKIFAIAILGFLFAVFAINLAQDAQNTATLANQTANNASTNTTLNLSLNTKVNKTGDNITGNLNVNGNFGIGTNSPITPVEIIGTSPSAVTYPNSLVTLRDNRTTSGSAVNYVQVITRQNSNSPAWYFGNDGNDDAVLAMNGRVKLRVGQDNGGAYQDYLIINETGQVFMYNLDNSTGSAVCRSFFPTYEIVENTGATTCLVSSIKYKTDIMYITTNATNTTKLLKPVLYTEKATGIKRVGFIAEDVKNDIPQYAKYLIVYEPYNSSDPRGLNWEGILTLTVKTLQEQIKVNEEQTTLLNKICVRNATLCS